MNERPEPNFFIVGAPKCGTTGLYEYLRAHPNVFMTVPKEPQYFAEDLPKYRLVRTQEQYDRLFRRCSDRHKARGEASNAYLFSSVAIPRIREVYADAKIIAMLRSPVEMAHAWHAQAILDGDETEHDFERAWRLQEDRRRGREVPRRCRHRELLLYKDWALYSGQIERLFAHFPREQVKIIIFDDFKADKKGIYESVLSFLGVPSDGRAEFPRINENRMLRFKLLGNYIENPPQFVRRCGESVKDTLGLNRLGILDPLRRLNRKKEPRPPLSAEFKREVATEFGKDVIKLSGFLNRNLTHWIKGPAIDESAARAQVLLR